MKNATEFRRICLPYVLQQQKDGSYIALNRNYKPIGFRFKGLSPDMIRKLSIQAHTDGDIYLYDDGCVPTRRKKHMTAYLEKLAMLMKLDVY